MSYTRVNWDTTTPINPTNMNNMDEGIFNNDSAIQTINGKIAELFKNDRVVISATMQGGGQYYENLYTRIQNITPVGYKFFAFGGWTLNNANIRLVAMRYVNSNYSLQIVNTTSSQQTSDVAIDIIFIKN